MAIGKLGLTLYSGIIRKVKVYKSFADLFSTDVICGQSRPTGGDLTFACPSEPHLEDMASGGFD